MKVEIDDNYVVGTTGKLLFHVIECNPDDENNNGRFEGIYRANSEKEAYDLMTFERMADVDDNQEFQTIQELYPKKYFEFTLIGKGI